MVQRISIVLICLALLHSTFLGLNGVVEADTAGIDDSGIMKPSKKRSTFLEDSCTSLGAGLAYTLTPMALCPAGFCSTGITSSSFAASWQSTLTLVAKGSLFAKLQAIAMGGLKAKASLSGAAVGGVVGLNFMTDLCEVVDHTDLDSPLGKSKAIEMKQNVKDYCDSSETGAVVSELAEGATTWASLRWNRFTLAASKRARLISLQWEISKLNIQLDKCKEKCWALNFGGTRLLEFWFPCINEVKFLEEKLSQREEEHSQLTDTS
jgi:hypothetical protein